MPLQTSERIAWRFGAVSAGDVVLVSALTFPILHGSRDLTLTLLDTTRKLGAVADTLQIMLQPHAIVDADVPLALAESDVCFEEVRFAYPERAAVLGD
ncbi:UNVERIFIED_ORG: ATP-binding cassette subfamily B protein [Xanthomonas axonopodis]